MPDRNLLHRADMVDVHGLAILPHRQDSIDNVVDITECPRLASVALNLDPILATGDSGAHFLDHLGDDVFQSHVRSNIAGGPGRRRVGNYVEIWVVPVELKHKKK